MVITKNTFIKLDIFSHLRRGKISNFMMAFFISSVIYSELLPDIKCSPGM